MTDTPRLGIAQLEEDQALPEVVINEGTRILEAFANAPHFKSRTTTAQPGSPADGDEYLLPGSSTGADWAGHDGEIAIFINTAWVFKPAKEGFFAWVDDDDEFIIFDGSAWNAFNPAAGPVGSSGLTMSTARLLGRTTASTGAIEEITVGSGLTLAAGSLSATGGGATVDVEDEGVLEASASTINFTGAGVTATDAGGGVVDIDIPGGGGGALVLISEATPSGVGVVTFSSIAATYRDLRLVVRGRGTTVAASVACNVTVNNDTGANYDIQRITGSGTTASAGQAFAQSNWAVVSLPAASAAAGISSSVEYVIHDYRGTVFHKGGHAFVNQKLGTASGDIDTSIFSMFWRSTVAIDRVDVTLAAGNFEAGSVVSLYGIM